VVERIAAEFHGVSSQTGSIKTTRKGVSYTSEEERAWRTDLSMSSDLFLISLGLMWFLVGIP
jgi:hypothetical protein